MKKIFLALLLLGSALVAQTDWRNYYDVYDEAKAQNKTALIMLSQEGCPGCEHMEDIVFEDPAVAKYLKDNFIVVNLDVHKEDVPEEFKFFATPTFYFVDADEKIIDSLTGGKNAKAFLRVLKQVRAER